MSNDVYSPGVLQVTTIHPGRVGVVRTGPGEGWGEHTMTDWKFGVNVRKLDSDLYGGDFWPEEWEEAGFKAERFPTITKQVRKVGLIGEREDNPSNGVAYHRVAGGFQISGDGPEVNGDWDLITVQTPDATVAAVATELGLDRLIHAVLGLTRAEVECAAGLVMDLHSLEYREAQLAKRVQGAHPEAAALAKAIEQAGSADEVAVPIFGTAYRRVLPGHQVQSKWMPKPLTVPPRTVWLVKLSPDATIPDQAVFDAAGPPVAPPRPSARAKPTAVPSFNMALALMFGPVTLLVIGFLAYRSCTHTPPRADVSIVVGDLVVGAGPPVELDTSGAPTRGPTDADAKIVEVGMLSEITGRYFDGKIEALLTEHPDRVSHTVLLYVPPGIASTDDELPGTGALCAHEQRFFWEYRATLFELGTPRDAAQRRVIAHAASPDTIEAWEDCVGRPDTSAQLRAQSRRYEHAGSATGAVFYVNGHQTNPFDLPRAVRGALAAADAEPAAER